MRYALASLLMLFFAAARADELYVFTRPGCAPCEKLKAALEANPQLVVGFDVFKINTAQRPDIAKRWAVTAVPVCVIVRDGKQLRRRLGFTNVVDLRDWLDDTQYEKKFRP